MDAEPQRIAETAGPAAGPAQASPLDEKQFALVQQAALRHKVATKAARTALFSSISTLVLAAVGLPLLIVFFSWWAVLIVVTLWTVGIVEFLGHQQLRRADPAACRILGINQLAFLAVIALYCLSQMATFSPQQIKLLLPTLWDAFVELAGPGAGAQVERWFEIGVFCFYSLVIVLSLFFQGGLALYYFTRRKRVEAYVRETPEWVRRVLLETKA